MEQQKNPKNTKKIVLAVVALIAAVAVLLGVYAATRKPAQAGTKTITVDVVLTDGSDTVSTLTTDAEYLRGALEEAGIRPEDVNLSVASRVEHGPIFTASDEGDVYQEAGNG